MTAFSTRARQFAQRQIDPETESRPPWRLGLIKDRFGHVHLGALVAASPGQPEIYIDLLSAVGAASVASLHLEELSVIVQGERIADLRQIIRDCIDDSRLRRRLLQLVALSAPGE
jgi:nitroreductase